MLVKKMGIVAATVALLGTVLTACGGTGNTGANEATAASESQTELTLWTFDTDPIWQASAEAVATEMNVKLNYEYIQDETYKTKISVALSANELPDVFEQHAGMSYRTPVLNAKVAAPLNDTLESTGLGDKFVEGKLVTESDGNIYSVPSNISTTLVMYYNKQLLGELGLDAPQSWEDLQAIVDAANAKGIIPIALGGKELWQADLLYNMLVLREDADAFTQAMNGEAKFTDAPFLEGANKVTKLVQANAFQKGFIGAAYLDAQELFKNNQAVIWIDGSFNFSQLSESMGENLGYVVFPKTGAEDVYSATLGFQNEQAPYSLFVNNSSEHVDVAKEFAVRLSLKLNDEFVRKGLPGYAETDVQSEVQNEELSAYAADVTKTSVTQGIWYGLVPADIGQEYRDLTQQLFAGSMTAEQFTQQLEATMRKAE